MDRSKSGKVDFSNDFPAVTAAPVHAGKTLRLRLFVDRSSIEAFGEDGKFVMTNLVFPSSPYNQMSFGTEGSGIQKLSSPSMYISCADALPSAGMKAGRSRSCYL